MDIGTATVVASGLGLIGTVFTVAVREFRSMKRKNTEDHGHVMARLDRVQDSIDHVAERLDDHVNDHLRYLQIQLQDQNHIHVEEVPKKQRRRKSV